MAVDIIFETHSWSEDNDRGIATGWLPGALSERGRVLAAELGQRRRNDGVAAVLCSDLARASQTAGIAFADSAIPILLDWRLRECNYGRLNGTDAAVLHADRQRYLTEPYPGGESWAQAVDRVRGCLRDLLTYRPGSRVLIIGHVATRWALDHVVDGRSLTDLSAGDFGWREGWEYRLDSA